MDFNRTKPALHSETLTNVLKRYQNDSLGAIYNCVGELWVRGGKIPNTVLLM